MVKQARPEAAPVARGVIEPCWMCGIRLSTASLVPDGGHACADIRWYCRDVRACTERWTSRAAGSVTARPGPAAAPAVPGPRQPLVRRATPPPESRPARGAAAVPGTGSSR
jgi:hypothetical protein